MEVLGIVLLVALGVGTVWLIIVLNRQGHPEDEVVRDLPENPGPTGEQYPTGSRPAGPGAEDMTPNPSETETEHG
jgi:hypothetical protein